MSENTSTPAPAAAQPAPPAAKAGEGAERGRPKSRLGIVVSNKMQKTVVVVVERRMRHGKYGKYMTEKKKYKAHDERNSCAVGDRVRITETRPMSKEKRWRVAEILGKGEAPTSGAKPAPAKAEG